MGRVSFAERHCSMVHGEVLMGMKAETCKREKPLIYLIRRAARNAFIIYAGEPAC